MKFRQYLEQTREEVAATVSLLQRWGFYRHHDSFDRFDLINDNGDRITLNGVGSGTDNFTHTNKAGKIYYGKTRDLASYLQSLPKPVPVDDGDDDDYFA